MKQFIAVLLLVTLAACGSTRAVCEACVITCGPVGVARCTDYGMGGGNCECKEAHP